MNLFFKTFFKNYVYMLNLSICIFGVTYIIKGKLTLVVGSTHCKPFDGGSKKNLSHFLSLTA